MKKLISLSLALLLLAALFAGCGDSAVPGDSTSAAADPTAAAGTTAAAETPAEAETPASTAAQTEPAGSSEASEPASETPEGSGAPFDMEGFLTKLSAARPDGSAQELCRDILESSYFTMFSLESTEYYYPGLDYEYTPEGIRESACVADFASGSGALVYVLVPEEGTDPAELAESFSAHIQPNWMDFENPPDRCFGTVLDGKVFVSLYRSEMQPIEGPVAEKARDFVEMFHSYVSEHPEADCEQIAAYFVSRQKLAGMDSYRVSEGQLTGFGDFETVTEIRGFSDGAIFTPQISPSTFLGYVFRVAENGDAEAFMAMLREKANLYWNVCVGADTIITAAEGDLVLFMMCTEGN